MAPIESLSPRVWVIYEEAAQGETTLLEAHVSGESAQAALKGVHVASSSNLYVAVLELKSEVDIEISDDKAKKTKSKKGKKTDPEKDENDDDDDSVEDTRKDPVIPGAKPNALKGLEIFLTGTMSKDRNTMKAIAINSGARLTSNPKKCDYCVLGAKPGPQKLKDVRAAKTDIITEEEFFEMLKMGVPDEKRQRMETDIEESEQETASEGNEPPPKKQKTQKK